MNKKVFPLYLIFLFVLLCVLLLPNKAPIFASKSQIDASYTFYTKTPVSSLNNVTVVQNGNMYLVNCSANDAFEVKSKLNNIEGESITFQGTKNDALNFFNKYNYEVIYSEMVENIFIIYAYCPQIQNHVFVNNQKTNLQLAINNQKITIGTPLILGSY